MLMTAGVEIALGIEHPYRTELLRLLRKGYTVNKAIKKIAVMVAKKTSYGNKSRALSNIRKLCEMMGLSEGPKVEKLLKHMNEVFERENDVSLGLSNG